MIFNKVSNINTFKYNEPREYINNVDSDIRNIMLTLQGRVRFGGGTDGQLGENVSGQFQVISDTGSADTEFTVAHNLGAIPIGYFVVKISKGGVIYTSTTSWTDSNIYLKCTTANTNVTIFLLK